MNEEIKVNIKRIFELCLRISESTENVAFFNYSGHTNQIDVHIGASEDNYNHRIADADTIYLNVSDNRSKENIIDRLNELEDNLDKILEQGGVITKPLKI
jgi:hypothetical protein